MHCFCTCYLLTQPLCGRYLSTWFAFDVCSTFPFQSISLLFDEHEHGLGLKFLNVLRLWRLRRVSSLFARYVRRVFFLKKRS
jgi:potassium channel